MQLPPGHQWSEYVRTEDPFWQGIRSCLVAFVAFDPEYHPQHLGTGFVIGTDPQGFIIVLTAKHVVEYAALKVQNPRSKRAPSSPRILFEPEKPRIGAKDLRAVWMGTSHVDILFVRHVAYAENLDVALCTLEAQDHLKPAIDGMIPGVALDTRMPSIGEWIHIVSLLDLKFNEVGVNIDGQGTWEISSRPVIRVGKVLSHQARSMGHRAASFTTSIPTPGGMSGGFAYVPRDGQPVAACGIVSTGRPEDETLSDFTVAGSSTLVGLLGALGLQVPTSTTPTYSLLLDLVKSDQIQDVAGGGENLAGWKTDDNGGFHIRRVSQE